jgi:hypothetical protein
MKKFLWLNFVLILTLFYIKIVGQYIKSAISYKYQFKKQLRSKTQVLL